jgi:hypothetical protein
LYAYLTVAQGGGEWFASDSGNIRKGETDRSTDWTGGRAGHRGSVGATEKRNSLSLTQVKPPSLDQPAIHFASTLSQSTHSISMHQELSSFKHYKILYNNTIFPFIWTAVQIVTENNREVMKKSFTNSSRNYNIEIK